MNEKDAQSRNIVEHPRAGDSKEIVQQKDVAEGLDDAAAGIPIQKVVRPCVGIHDLALLKQLLFSVPILHELVSKSSPPPSIP